MVEAGILEKEHLNEPADWVSSLVCVDKPDGCICVRLDPRDVNVAIKQLLGHYHNQQIYTLYVFNTFLRLACIKQGF